MEKDLRPVRGIEVLNPFRPASERKEHLFVYDGLRPLAQVLDGMDIDRQACAVSVNGGVIPDEELGITMVAPGDCVIASPHVGGGVWRTLAMIAVIAAAIFVPFLLTGVGALSLAGTTASTLSFAIGVGILVGGSFLVNMFLGPSLGGGQKSIGSTYDPTGPKTLAIPGTPIPKGYGFFKWGGNVIASFVDQEGADDWLNVLVCYGFGPAMATGSVELNGKDISAYRAITYQVRLGTNDQTPIPGFNKVVNGFPQETRMLHASGPLVVPGTGLGVQALEVSVKFVNGLIRFDDHGNPKQLSLAYQVEYSVHGLGAWKPLISPRNTHDIVTFDILGHRIFPFWVVIPTDQFQSSGIIYSTDSDPGAHHPGEAWTNTQAVTFYNPDGSSFAGTIDLQGEWQPCNPNLNQQAVDDWWGGYRVITAMQTDPFYDTVKIYGLPAGHYDVRVTKYGSGPHGGPVLPGDDPSSNHQQEVWLWNINEIFFQDLAYPNMILVAIRALATNQLSGLNLKVLTEITHDLGVALPAEFGIIFHDNPAAVAYDIVKNPLYGAGALVGYEIDIPTWKAWADFNNELVSDLNGELIRRHVFNGVFDTDGNVWAALQTVASMSRAMIVPIGKLLTVVLDRDSSPVQIFHVGNIKKDSFEETWLALDDRTNQVEVEFADEQRNFRTDLPVSVMTPEDINAGLAAKSTRVSLLGCTNRSRAWLWAYQKLLSTKLLLRSIKFNCNVEAIACQMGSIIGVQHDVTQWGFGGRIQDGSTATLLNIDRDDLPAFVGGAGWTVAVMHPVVDRGPVLITGIAGAVITVAAIPGGRIVKLVAPNGTETKVLNVNGTSLTVASTASFANGQIVECYDQDAIETRAVVALNGKQISVVGTPFSAPPFADAPWLYGQSAGDLPAKLFRVGNIRQTGDLDFAIEAVEHNAATDADATVLLGDVIGTGRSEAEVTNLNVVESYQFAGNKNTQQALISVSWTPGRDTVGAAVYTQTDGSAITFLTNTRSTGTSFYATTGDLLTIIVVGYDKAGVFAPFAQAPQATITVNGSTAAPADVTGFFLSSPAVPGSGTPPVAIWNAMAGIDHFEVRFARLDSVPWESAQLLSAGIPGANTTFGVATDDIGHYFIKAWNAAGVASVHAAEADWLNLPGPIGIGPTGPGDGGGGPGAGPGPGPIGPGPVLTLGSMHDKLSLTLAGKSSLLSNQGSVLPVPDAAYTLTTANVAGVCSITVDVPLFNSPKPDGTSVAVPHRNATWAGLAASTTYYFYRYIDLLTGALKYVVEPGTAPDTAPNSTHSAAANADGRIGLSPITVTTPATAGGSGSGSGGDSGCPEWNEWVETRERGRVRVKTVQAGEHVKGRNLKTGAECWRQVVRVEFERRTSWYRVKRHKLTPQHWFRRGGEWAMPYIFGTFHEEESCAARLVTDAGDFDEQNYLLLGGEEELLIHNYNPLLS